MSNRFLTGTAMALLLILGLVFSGMTTEATAGDWQPNGNDIYYDTGNVGIGTTTPAEKLSVTGDIALGDGTDTSLYLKFDRATTDPKFGFDNTIGMWNSPGFYLSNSIYIDSTSNFSGYYLGPNGQYGGFVKKNGYPYPMIASDSVFLGTDGMGVALAWDTNQDGFWAYCEGLTYNPGIVNCADYTGIMGPDDFFWIWKHGAWKDSQKDLKFLFDGETHDGIMGFMEDENHFFFDNDVVVNGNVGIGTTTPTAKLDVVGDINSTQLCIAGDCKASWSGVGTIWSQTGNDAYFDSGNVGIGTSTPAAKFHLVDSTTTGEVLNVNDILYVTSGTAWRSVGINRVPERWFGQALAVSGGNLDVIDSGINARSYGSKIPNIRMLHYNGSEGNETATLAGDRLGNLMWYGSDTVGGVELGAQISSFAENNATHDQINSDMRFYTSGSPCCGAENAEKMRIKSNGNVGIGTKSPLSKLHVEGDGTGNEDNAKVTIKDTRIDGYSTLSLANDAGQWYFRNYGPDDDSLYIGRDFGGSQNHLIITKGGNIGIGTATPAEKLEVNGKIRAIDPQFYNTVRLYATNSFATDDYTKVFTERDGTDGTRFKIATKTDGGTLSEKVTVLANGNVGIGTSTPAVSLDVKGSGLLLRDGTTNTVNLLVSQSNKNTMLRLNNDAVIGEGKYAGIEFYSYSPAYDSGKPQAEIRAYNEPTVGGGYGTELQFYTAYTGTVNAANQKMVIKSSGDVGIGTTSPVAKLEVKASGTTSQELFRIKDSADTNQFAVSSNSNGNPVLNIYDTGGTDDVQIHTSGSSWLNGGNVGIGTASPQKLLHVAGDVQIDGNIAAKYQDLAEWVMTTEPLTPGTVVMIDKGEIDHVAASDTAYNTLVAGVVSKQPGIILGEASDDKAVIAHTGRVKVKVDTTNGAIATGDLLVTSSLKGYAMRSEPIDIGGAKIHRPGTIIGKALEPLAKGQKGEVLALITLQ